MEWAKEKTKAATETVKDTTNQVLESSPVQEATDTAESVYEGAAETAGSVYDTAADYVPRTGKNTPNMTASIINTQPFASFKPDPANVWKGYLIFLLLAAGCTLPWWTFIIAVDYFNFLYPHSHIVRLFPLIYFGAWLVVYVLFSAFGREYTSWARINIGLMISMVALIAMPVMDGIFIKGQHGTTATFWVTLAAVGISGLGDGIAQGSLLGISSELPERFTHAYTTGTSLSGVFMFIVRVITKAALNSSPSGLRISAIIYFSLAPVFLVGVLSLFAYVHYMPSMAYYNSIGLGSFDTVRLLVEDEASVSIEVAASAGIAAVAAGRSCPAQPLEYKPVLSRVKLLAVAVFITAMISMIIFPGFLAEDVHSKSLGSWYPVLLIGTYLVLDILGRYLTRHTIPERHSALFGAAWARLILLVFFVFAIFVYGKTKIPMIFTLTALLGLSNGFLSACFTVVVPRSNPADQAEPAGIIMATVMTVGCLVGAGLNWLWLLVR